MESCIFLGLNKPKPKPKPNDTQGPLFKIESPWEGVTKPHFGYQFSGTIHIEKQKEY